MNLIIFVVNLKKALHIKWCIYRNENVAATHAVQLSKSSEVNGHRRVLLCVHARAHTNTFTTGGLHDLIFEIILEEMLLLYLCMQKNSRDTVAFT